MMQSARSRRSRPVLVTGLVAILGSGAGIAVAGLSSFYSVDGTGASDQYGNALALVGDLDGDGLPEFAVASKAIGLVLVCSGKDGSTLHKLSGSSGDEFGASVAGAGDVDGDGVPDVIVGAPKEYDPNKTQTGAAHVFSGKDASTIASMYGDYSGDLFGSAVAGCGDLDGDGLDDVFVGASYGLNPNLKKSIPGSGKFCLGNSGKAFATVYGDKTGDGFGASATRVKDTDGDKIDDVAVGAITGADSSGNATGYVRLFSAASQKSIATAYGDAASDQFGAAVADAGDVNGDGTTDVVVGAPAGADAKGNATGYARVLSGSDLSTVHTVYGDASGDGLGTGVGGGQDLDGDGNADFVAGAPGMLDGSSTDTGAVRTYASADGSELGTTFGGASADAFGTCVALSPDLDGDGNADLLVAAPGSDASATDGGSVYALGAGGTSSAPSGTVVIEAGASGTASRNVTLGFTWADGSGTVTEMRFRSAGGAWGNWVPVATTAAYTLPANDGTKTVEAQFRDDGLVESAVVTDTILLDTTAPTGTVSIASGAAWSGTSTVSVGLSAGDGAGTGVARYRIRNAGGAFGTAAAIVPSVTFGLTAGAGTRTVEVEFEDAVGNRSTIVSDSIGVDLSAPNCAVQIAGGNAFASDRNVNVVVSATDTGGAGIREMRLRKSSSAPWGAWTTFSNSVSWTLDAGEGTHTVEAQVRDAALNESAVASDTIEFDGVRPVVTAFSLREPRSYYPSSAVLSFDVAANDGDGSGVDAIRTTWDGGVTWTPWVPLPSGAYTPPRPGGLSGDAGAQVAVRDLAGNESIVSGAATMYFLPAENPDLGSGGTATGTLSGLNDIDVLVLDLVEGDSLSVALKAVPAVKKTSFVLALDLLDPDGVPVVDARFPVASGTPGIKGFTATRTGRHTLVVRHADQDGSDRGSWSLKMSVKAAKANAAAKGSHPAEFSFDAADGGTFSAVLSGPGIVPGSIVLSGPDGDVPVTTKVKGTKVGVGPVVLTQGTGTYTLRYTASGEVSFAWKSALPKGTAKITE